MVSRSARGDNGPSRPRPDPVADRPAALLPVAALPVRGPAWHLVRRCTCSLIELGAIQFRGLHPASSEPLCVLHLALRSLKQPLWTPLPQQNQLTIGFLLATFRGGGRSRPGRDARRYRCRQHHYRGTERRRMGLPPASATVGPHSGPLYRAGIDRTPGDGERQRPCRTHQGAFRTRLGLVVGCDAGPRLRRSAVERTERACRRRS